MPVQSFSVSVEVNPSPTERIHCSLGKSFDAQGGIVWKLFFELLEGNPLRTVVKLNVEIDSVNSPQAEATLNTGFDDNQQGQAQIAAAVVRDAEASPSDKHTALQQVIAAKNMAAAAAL
jgi:hypothetical protein